MAERKEHPMTAADRLANLDKKQAAAYKAREKALADLEALREEINEKITADAVGESTYRKPDRDKDAKALWDAEQALRAADTAVEALDKARTACEREEAKERLESARTVLTGHATEASLVLKQIEDLGRQIVAKIADLEELRQAYGTAKAAHDAAWREATNDAPVRSPVLAEGVTWPAHLVDTITRQAVGSDDPRDVAVALFGQEDPWHKVLEGDSPEILAEEAKVQARILESGGIPEIEEVPAPTTGKTFTPAPSKPSPQVEGGTPPHRTQRFCLEGESNGEEDAPPDAA